MFCLTVTQAQQPVLHMATSQVTVSSIHQRTGAGSLQECWSSMTVTLLQHRHTVGTSPFHPTVRKYACTHPLLNVCEFRSCLCPLLCAIQVAYACNAAAVSELYTKPCILLLEDAHKLHCNSSCSTCESQRHIRVCCQQTKHMHALVPMFSAATCITVTYCVTGI